MAVIDIKSMFEPINSNLVKDKAKEAIEYHNSAIENAKKCLNNPIFKKYREDAEKSKGLLLKSLLSYTDPDPIKYAFGVQKLIDRIDKLTWLLDSVERDANRKLKEMV